MTYSLFFMAIEKSSSSISKLQFCHSKRKKEREQEQEQEQEREQEQEQELISTFPDDILCHILSYLPTKDVVRTSILSKGWSSVWTSVRSIDINDYYQWRGDERKQIRKSLLMDFVDRVLLRSNHDMFVLQKFHLKLQLGYNKSRISKWVKALATHVVEDLELDFLHHRDIKPPPSFFTCNKLMVLKLGHGFHLDIPSPVCLPSLKILHLFGLSLFNDASMKNLLGGSPVLEDLVINWCSYVEMKTLFIRSSSLMSLRVTNRNINLDSDNINRDAIGIIVDATKLERLDLTFGMTEQCDMSSISSLIKVKLDIYHLRETIRVDGDKIVELLRSMSHTKCMHLSYHTMKFLEGARLDNLPVFRNLIRLELEIDENGWQILPYLLECSPKLVNFVLKFLFDKDPHEWHQLYREPKCLMLYLQEIELTGFISCTHGMELVRYFLKNATILKKMRICFSYFCFKKEIIEKLLLFPRSSSECQVSFY